jgi:hypothetical protein
MTADKDKLRRDWQKIKSLNQENFWKYWNEYHSQAYFLAEKHYGEAMYIYLDAPVRAKIEAKVKEIRELWDGYNVVEEETKPL